MNDYGIVLAKLKSIRFDLISNGDPIEHSRSIKWVTDLIDFFEYEQIKQIKIQRESERV